MTSLSSQERTVIQTLLELNYSIRAIARFIKRSPSTVSIEIHQVTLPNLRMRIPRLTNSLNALWIVERFIFNFFAKSRSTGNCSPGSRSPF